MPESSPTPNAAPRKQQFASAKTRPEVFQQAVLDFDAFSGLSDLEAAKACLRLTLARAACLPQCVPILAFCMFAKTV